MHEVCHFSLAQYVNNTCNCIRWFTRMCWKILWASHTAKYTIAHLAIISNTIDVRIVNCLPFVISFVCTMRCSLRSTDTLLTHKSGLTFISVTELSASDRSNKYDYFLSQNKNRIGFLLEWETKKWSQNRSHLSRKIFRLCDRIGSIGECRSICLNIKFNKK